MSSVSIISFIICLAIFASVFKNDADVFSPGRVFAFIWALAIGLTDLKLSRLQHEWSIEVWIQIMIGPISFLIGTTVMYVINFDKKIYTLNYLRSHREIYNIDKLKLYYSVVFLFALFLFGYLIIYMVTKEIPIFSEKPGVARANFTMFGIGLFLHNVVLIGFLSVVYILLEKNNKKKKSVLVLLTIISVILYSITLQRYQIFLTIIMIAVLLYYTTFRLKFRTVVISVSIIVVFFFLVSSFRAGQVIIFVLYRISEMKFSPQYAIFTEPYMYVVMNLENYARSITKINEYTLGYYTFDFYTAISGLKTWIQEYNNLNETPFLTSNYNTYSAFWTYYRDFGILGIFIIPFLGGVFLSSLFYSFKKNPTVQKLALYSIFLFGIMFSFFNSAFGFLWYIYNLIVIILVFKYITISQNKNLSY